MPSGNLVETKRFDGGFTTMTSAKPVYSIIHDYMQVNGGAERLVLTLARGLPGAKLSVSGVYPDFSGSADVGGVPVEELNSRLRGAPRVLRALLTFGLMKPDLEDAQFVIYSGFFAPLAARHQTHGRRIYYCHTPPRFAFDREEEYLQFVPAPAKAVFRKLISHYREAYLHEIRAMDVVIANSQHVRQRLLAQTGVDAQVVYPPIDTRKWKYLGEGDYYLSVARLEPYKRVDRIVRAFCCMPDKKLIIASGGSQLAALRELAGNATNITFTGWIDDQKLAQLIGNARAIIYIPKDEDFGMSAVEAMAAGKPVLGVNEGGLRETIVDGETGFLLGVDPSHLDIADTIRNISFSKLQQMRMPCEQRAKLFAEAVFIENLIDAVNGTTRHPHALA